MAKTIPVQGIQKQQAIAPVSGAQARVQPKIKPPVIPTVDISNFSETTWKNAHHYNPTVERPAFESEPGSMGRRDSGASPLQTLKLYNDAAANVAREGASAQQEQPGFRVSARIENGGAIPAKAQARPAPAEGGEGAPKRSTGCETCDSRRYQDGSGDSGVSFQSAKGMPSSTAGRFVASHEGEHVSRESAKARQEGRQVTQKKVTMEMGFCPDCNRLYAKGGKTTIQTQSAEGSAVVTKLSDVLRGNGEKLNINT